jgi:hypothetical protein
VAGAAWLGVAGALVGGVWASVGAGAAGCVGAGGALAGAGGCVVAAGAGLLAVEPAHAASTNVAGIARQRRRNMRREDWFCFIVRLLVQ